VNYSAFLAGKPDSTANRLQFLRLRAGLTESQLYHAAGIHANSLTQTITAYERGDVRPRPLNLMRLADALRVDVKAFDPLTMPPTGEIPDPQVKRRPEPEQAARATFDRHGRVAW
jgi:transcriptional regulator with XRE-family HTH domain